MKEVRIELYGTGWCPKSAVIRNYLQSKWIEFDDYNVETDSEAANRVRALYNGELKFPTLVQGDIFLKNPTKNQIDTFLKKTEI